MNTLKIKTFVIAGFAALMATGGSFAHATSVVEGVVQGFNCVLQQKVCAVDRFDPRLGLEEHFVVIDKNGVDYLVTNIDSSILAEQYLNQVRISGNVNKKYKSAVADKLEKLENGVWKEVWSLKRQEEALEALDRKNFGG